LPLQFAVVPEIRKETDPDDAFFLRDGMSFDGGSGLFSWTPPEGLAGRSRVRFQATTPSAAAPTPRRITVGGVSRCRTGRVPARLALEPASPILRAESSRSPLHSRAAR